MVVIQLTTGLLDVKEGTAFPLNFQVGDIRDISSRKGSFSKTITLIGSKNNNNLLNHYYDVNIQAGTFDINKLTLCSVIQDGIPIMENASMQLTGIKKLQTTDGLDEQVDYEVLIKDSKLDLFTAINNKELTDLDFTDFNHTYDAFNVKNRFANTVVNGFKYFLPASGDAIYSTQEFKPSIFAKVYFDRIFNAAGFTYNWPTLSSYDRFDKLIIPYNGGVDNFDYADYVVKAAINTPVTLLATNTTPGFSTMPSVPPTTGPRTITGFTEIEDPQNLFNPVTGVYTTPFNISISNGQYYKYDITMSYEVRLNNTSGVTLYSGTPTWGTNPTYYEPKLSVQTPGGNLMLINLYTRPLPIVGQSQLNNAFASPLTIAPGSTTILSQTISTSLPLSASLLAQGSSGLLRMSVDQKYARNSANIDIVSAFRIGSPLGAFGNFQLSVVITSMSLSITPSANITTIGGIIDVNDYVPKKIKQSDFVKAVFNMYNLYSEPDKDQPNIINLISRDDYYDAGVEVDWTYKLAKDEEQDLSFIPELTSKKIILSYAPDKDSPNTVYSNAINQTYGQAEVVFDNEYVKDVTTKSILFSPTPVIKTIFGAYVPMIAGSAPETNIRILYDKTTIGQPLATCGQFYIYDYGSVGQINLTSYPLVGHFDDPLTPTFDINFAVCSFYYYQPTSLTDNNLYNRYWRRTMGQINNGRMLTAYFDLRDTDIQKLHLNDKIRIDNSWWNINKVIDYDANARKLTKVELISIDNEINFTPFMGGSGPVIPTPIASIGTMQFMGMSSVNNTRIANSNVIGEGGTSLVMGRGNIVVGGIRSMVAGNDIIASEDGMYVNNIIANSYNGVAYIAPPQKYVAVINQTGLLDPVAVTVENTFGGITWTRGGIGQYRGFLDDYTPGDILPTKAIVLSCNNSSDILISTYFSSTDNCIYVSTIKIGVGYEDSLLVNFNLEFRKYE